MATNVSDIGMYQPNTSTCVALVKGVLGEVQAGTWI